MRLFILFKFLSSIRQPGSSTSEQNSLSSPLLCSNSASQRLRYISEGDGRLHEHRQTRLTPSAKRSKSRIGPELVSQAHLGSCRSEWLTELSSTQHNWDMAPESRGFHSIGMWQNSPADFQLLRSCPRRVFKSSQDIVSFKILEPPQAPKQNTSINMFWHVCSYLALIISSSRIIYYSFCISYWCQTRSLMTCTVTSALLYLDKKNEFL